MTENKGNQNAKGILRSDLKWLLSNSIPRLDKYADTLYKKLEPRLDAINSGVKPSRAEFLRTRRLAAEYMTYVGFSYFAQLIDQLYDSIDAIRDGLPEAQKQRLKELDDKVTEIHKGIDAHHTKRISELFGKNGADYIT
jgi:hypothetical protein